MACGAVAIRYTGISVAYQLSTALFAGTAPFVSQWLLTSTGSIWPVVGLAVFYVVLSVACMSFLLRGSAWRDRDMHHDGVDPGADVTTTAGTAKDEAGTMTGNAGPAGTPRLLVADSTD